MRNAELADLFRRCAAGRREYAERAISEESRNLLLAQAEVLDSAARVAEGDMGPVYSWLPSWRWADEMNPRARVGGTPEPEGS